tara:strand:- start:2393 stop:2563 length:171 start_codon:yes stop_codon:yes gene_type:complete
MTNQNLNPDFYLGMKEDPYGIPINMSTEKLTSKDWSEYYYIEATRYQAFINLTSNK